MSCRECMSPTRHREGCSNLRYCSQCGSSGKHRLACSRRHDPSRGRRSDLKPEFIEYRDTGCDLAPACLACPFDVCRYDAGVQKMLVTA